MKRPEYIGRHEPAVGHTREERSLSTIFLQVQAKQQFINDFLSTHPLQPDDDEYTRYTHEILQLLSECSTPEKLGEIISYPRFIYLCDWGEHEVVLPWASEKQKRTFRYFSVIQKIFFGSLQFKLFIAQAKEAYQARLNRRTHIPEENPAINPTHGIGERLANSSSPWKKEDVEFAVNRYRAWTERLIGLEWDRKKILETLSTILFKECGYMSPPLLAEVFPTLQGILPKAKGGIDRADDYISLAVYGKGNCGAKSDAVAILLEQTVYESHAMGITATSFYDNEESLQRLKKFLHEHPNSFTVEELGQVIHVEPRSERQYEHAIRYFQESFSIKNTFGIEVPHARTVVRISDMMQNTVEYFVIEPDGDQAIQPWSPQNDDCLKIFYRRFENHRYRHVHSPSLYTMICSDFDLPPDFRFQVAPVLRDPAERRTMHMLRSTIIEPESKGVPENVPYHEQEGMVNELKDTLASIGALAIDVQKTATIKQSPRVAAHREEQEPLLPNAARLLQRVCELVRDHPFASAVVALTTAVDVAALTRLYQKWSPDTKKAAQTFVEKELISLNSSQLQTACVEYLSDCTDGVNWQLDARRAEAYADNMATSFDVVNTGFTDTEGTLVASNKQAALPSVMTVSLGDDYAMVELQPAAHSKLLNVRLDSIEGNHTVDVTLASNILTVSPSFWVPVLRRAAKEGGVVDVSVSGEALDISAVTASFAHLVNRLAQDAALEQLQRLTIRVNGTAVILTAFDNGKKNHTIFNSQFRLRQDGSIEPTPELQERATKDCLTPPHPLPSGWATRSAAAWAYPLCR